MNWKKYFELFGDRPQKKTPVAAGVQSCPPISGYISMGDTYMFTMLQENSRNENIFASCTNGHAITRAERWLSDRIKRGRKEPFSEVATLTPELASLLLSYNDCNRPVKKYEVDGISADIKAGRWKLNGETIIVSSDGLLNDGQHRCMAVVEAGEPIRTMMAFGVDRDTRTTVDGGTARTPGDYLGMAGVGNSNNVAAAARKIIEIERNGKMITGLYGAVTKQEILDRGQRDRMIAEAVRATGIAGANKVASNSLLAAAYYFFAKVDRIAADDFIGKLIKGADLKERSPIWTAREKLLRRDKRLNQNEQMKTIIMAWNGWRSGAKSKKSLTHSVKKGEKLPEIRA